MLRICPILLALLLLSACGGKVITKTEAAKAPEPPKPPSSVPAWLGNPSRNFYGTGPWSGKQLEVVWSVETKGISGRLHKDPWGGSSWPGQLAQIQFLVLGLAVGWRRAGSGHAVAVPNSEGSRLLAATVDPAISRRTKAWS